MDTQIAHEQIGELVCWRIRHRGAQLLIAEQGAQLLSYQRDDGPPLRGGIPVCWPWFGALERNPDEVGGQYAGNSAPAHGLVRTLDWRLEDIRQASDAVEIEFVFDTREQPLPEWPHTAELRLLIRLDQRLHLKLTSHNHGLHPLFLSQALHTYFAVSDIREVHVEGLHGCRYIETLEDWQARLQQGPVNFTGETDRIYLGVPSQVCVRDPQWQRRIHVMSSGSQSAVVWNPWIGKSRFLSQFAADAWTGMLCIETANVLDDRIELLPGAAHTLAVSLWESQLE